MVIDIECPFCSSNTLEINNEHPYSKLSGNIKWFYCSVCDRNYLYDRLDGSWKIDPYDYDPDDYEEEDQDEDAEDE